MPFRSAVVNLAIMALTGSVIPIEERESVVMSFHALLVRLQRGHLLLGPVHQICQAHDGSAAHMNFFFWQPP